MDTSDALLFHQQFFKNLSGVEKVYSFGFSFSDVDLIYIKEICKNIDVENVRWYINEFDKAKCESFEEKITSCGFKGEILEYST